MLAPPAAGRLSARLRPLLAVVAGVFAASTLLYSTLWMVAVDWLPQVELGFDTSFRPVERVQAVTAVNPGSPAEAAGLLPGDRILAVNGRRFETSASLHQFYAPYKPGDTVQLTVLRSGRADPILLTGVFRRRVSSTEGLEYAVRRFLNLFPLPFAVVGLTVLFLRLGDPHVWLLAFLFATFVAAPGYPTAIASIAPWLGGFAGAYRALFRGLLGALFYWFFAIFPNRSPLDRRLPSLKWVGLAAGLLFGVSGVRSGDMQPPEAILHLLGDSVSAKVTQFYIYGFVVLGLVSLAGNLVSATDPQARRKLRVLFWGAAAGLSPILLVGAADDLTGFSAPKWLDIAASGMLFLFPLSFAYAVVKHRVLELPALIQRSARYLLVQRGFTVVLGLGSLGLMTVFALTFPRYLPAATGAAQPSGVALGALFGTLLLWGGSRVHQRVSGRIDRAFFRNAYDARVILEDLAEASRVATDRGELAASLHGHLQRALQPSSLVVYLETGDDDCLVATAGTAPPGLNAIARKSPLVIEARQRGRPWEPEPEAAAGAAELAPLRPDCIVPIMARAGRLAGLLALGPRLSEEPYSGEDKRLLSSVASQAGAALESIRLAEEIAERMEADRRVAREMEIAREVQRGLLPETPPELDTLECAAQCLQARAVGGDYFDFLDLGPHCTGFVLADVSGKGVHAALLMANLQAHLRSQSAIAPADPARLLGEVNRMLRKSTGSRHYATLFLGIYDDIARTLVYANCGHNAPVLLRSGGAVERLEATTTVVGLFERWECPVKQVRMDPGDLLAVFSDGITEAACGEDEFGEERLIELLRSNAGLPPGDLVSAILGGVQRFSAGTQSDDLTLLVARARPVQ